MELPLKAPHQRPGLHRAFTRFPVDRRGLVTGLVVAIMVIGVSMTFATSIWRVEGIALRKVLAYSNVAAKSSHSYIAVASDSRKTPATGAIAGIAAFLALTLGAVKWRRVPIPAKVLWVLFATIGIASLWYSAFIAGPPQQSISALKIGFQNSGLLGVMVVVALFGFEVFPIPGRLRYKLGWLVAFIAFAFVWSVVRMAFILGTANHLGSWTFLYLQYIAGPIVDFLSVVVIYSLATHGLAKRLGEYVA